MCILGVGICVNGRWPGPPETSPAANKFPSEIGNNQLPAHLEIVRGGNCRFKERVKILNFKIGQFENQIRLSFCEGRLFRSGRRLIHPSPYPPVQHHFLPTSGKVESELHEVKVCIKQATFISYFGVTYLMAIQPRIQGNIAMYCISGQIANYSWLYSYQGTLLKGREGSNPCSKSYVADFV